MKMILTLTTFLLIALQLSGQQVKSFQTSDNETLFYTSKGNGPIVVFLYGGPGISAGPMRPWADSLSNKYECIIYEQRGTGLSSKVKLDSNTINLNRAVKDIDELRKHLGERQLTICGISWGGGLAQAYAAYYRENTENIVLICTLGPDRSLMSAFSDNTRMRRFPNERDSLSYWNKQPVSELSLMKRRLFSYIPAFYDHSIGYKMLPQFFAAATYHDKMGSLMTADLNKNYNLNTKLTGYHGKCTIVKTRQDYLPEEMTYQIKSLLPQANMVTIERCGHFPDYEKPKEFFKILRQVL